MSSPSGAVKPLRERMVDGTARVFVAEALMVPTGLLTVAYLTRRLGPADYGRYTLAIALITWLEWGFSAPFARAAVRVVGAAADWRPVATLVLRTQLILGVLTAIGLWVGAPFAAVVLDEPRLTSLLRLLALDLPLFALAQAHQQILVALGRFRIRALLPLVRWSVRLVLIVVCVEAGLSVYGVILAIIGTSVAEIVLARRFVRPPIFGRTDVPVRQLFDYAVPLLLSALCLRIFDRIDVVLLKYLGRSAVEVGMYGAAQNLTLATGLFAIAFAPVLLSTVTQAVRGGDLAHARQIARDSMRCVLLLIPFAAVMAASAGEIVGLLFGDQYLHSTQVFQYLIFAGVGNVAVSIGAAILTGAGRPSWTLWISAPLPAVAIVAHAWAIPRYGPSGAAFVTAVCATGGALVGFVAIQRFWDATPPFATLIKSALIATAGAAVAASWSTPGLLVLLKLGALCTAFVVLMLVSGELDAAPVLSDLLPGLFQRSGPTDRIQDPLEPVGQYSAKTSSTSPTVTQASSAS